MLVRCKTPLLPLEDDIRSSFMTLIAHQVVEDGDRFIDAHTRLINTS